MKDYKEIIEYAIQKEIEAETFYKEIAAKISKPVIRDLFTEFAKEENKHQKILNAVLNDSEAKTHFKKSNDYGVAETVDKPIVTGDMKVADAFAIAMKNEEEAMKMYQKLAADTTSDRVKALFLDLAAMEQGHKFKMEQAYTDVAYVEVW